MIPGLTGTLLSHDALVRAIPEAMGARLDPDGGLQARRRVHGWHARIRHEMGPAWSARMVFDRLAVPLCEALGFHVTACGSESGRLMRATIGVEGRPVAGLLVTGWGQDAAAPWRESVRHGIGGALGWCLCITGPRLRLLDARRTYSRRFAEFDIDTAIDDPRAFGVLWGLLRAEAFTRDVSGGSLLDAAVRLSERHRMAVRASLQEGVHIALALLVRAFCRARGRVARATADDPRLFDESLTVVYRILFLLFAEARGLVPQWHPTYRDNYTIDALRPAVERGDGHGGLWESLQAIARLAHHGCDAGTLRVPPFNGRLFSPAHAPLADSTRLDEEAVRGALLALTTRTGREGRERIAYGDLGVEQLGGVYERILDDEPSFFEGRPTPVATRHGGRRKATGSFYTPRSLTEYLVRRTLAPLVHDAAADRILSLRVLDPAMGSGAFLVAACRYLASAYEAALIRDGVRAEGDVDDSDRAGFRRLIAQRCLFGVDVNPMAVQLGRLSLWLTTLARDRPLTFLDHNLRAGNSLIGASLDDLARQPPSGDRRRRPSPLPLFDLQPAESVLGATVGPRLTIAHGDAETLHQVRAKERLLASLLRADAPLARWKGVADLWCAAWFGSAAKDHAVSWRTLYGALADEILGRPSVLAPRTAQPLLADVRRTAAREQFFHWGLEFPEVFYDADGRALDAAGFDVVVANPPWKTLRGDAGGSAVEAGDSGSRLTAFARASGVYRLQRDGHVNLYQLFFERALSLVRPGGRIGIVLPSGFASDHGCGALRRHAFNCCDIDTFTSLENRDGVFPIHRGLRFLLITATTGSNTAVLPCRFGVRSPAVLDELPDSGVDPAAVPVPRGLIERLTAGELAIPELRAPRDLSIVERIVYSVPLISDDQGWGVTFGRELNATDDSRHFVERGTTGRGALLPVVEGKQIQPFVVDREASRLFIPTATAAAVLDPARTYGRRRLAYRDVASATNRLTLIAAILPTDVVSTHTLFCLKDGADDEAQVFLCGMLNSFVANYLVRLRVSTHVTVGIVERLPVPRPPRDSYAFRQMTVLAGRLLTDPHDPAAAADLQAQAARLYGLTAGEFEHVLGTFPLVPALERRAALEAFRTSAPSPKSVD
jgi:hypothetical protein